MARGVNQPPALFSLTEIAQRLKRSWMLVLGLAVFFFDAPPLRIYRSIAPPHDESFKTFARTFYLMAAAAVLVVMIVVKFKKRLLRIFVLFLTASIGYFAFYLLLVKSPSGKPNVHVIVGFIQSDWAKKTYPDLTDPEILHEGGARQENIEKAWTPPSVFAANICLGLLFIASVNSLLAIAMYLAQHEGTSPRRAQPQAAPAPQVRRLRR